MFEVHTSILFIRKQDNRQICQLRDFLTRLILNKLPGKCDFQCRLSCRGKKGIRRVIDPKNKLLFASQLLPVAIFLSSRFLFLCFLIFIKIIQINNLLFGFFWLFLFLLRHWIFIDRFRRRKERLFGVFFAFEPHNRKHRRRIDLSNILLLLARIWGRWTRPSSEKRHFWK